MIAACCLLSGIAPALAAEGPDAAAADSPGDYASAVLADKPVAYWRLSEQEGPLVRSTAGASHDAQLEGRVEGRVELDADGPQPPVFPDFVASNSGARFPGRDALIRVVDPGDQSVLDFHGGESITLEAWVRLEEIGNGQQIYIVGKGRTQRPGQSADNQNYALRLRGDGSTGRVSFLYRDDRAEGSQFHRWNSSLGVPAGGDWHHVAVCFTFGDASSVHAYVDGQRSDGSWDMGGGSGLAPVVDDDELWIGSSMGGNAGSTFHGALDEVAVYRHVLDSIAISSHYHARRPPRRDPVTPLADLPDDSVRVAIFEKLADRSWTWDLDDPTVVYHEPVFGFARLPNAYDHHGVIADRSNPCLVRAEAKRTVSGGSYRLLLRSLGAARLYVDNQLVAESDFITRNASGHEEVPELADPLYQGLRPLPPGHQEQMVPLELSPGTHCFRLDAFVGGKGVRLEVGELAVAMAEEGQPLTLLAADPQRSTVLSDEGWSEWLANAHDRLNHLDARLRAEAARDELAYWEQRHELARRWMADQPSVEVPAPTPGLPARNAVDHFVNARLAAAGVEPMAPLDDLAFLRRASLDTIGVVPSLEQLQRFLKDEESARRRLAIDRLLDHPAWADHWVSYWQDVLAENPGILKPELNNTGPFRWWIYESFRDNKSFDRFVTELVMMEGSTYYGGPAGFAMATQNDAPMAAKAHVLGQAFLGIEMKCARCHDAPYHPFSQEQLFEVAAMLQRKPIKLPASSTVPAPPDGRQPLVSSSLEPGDVIESRWPFADLAPAQLPDGVLRRTGDSREQLAAILTSPQNDRFAQVVVNRLWARYLGSGLVEPVDDWDRPEPSHPELLRYLAREFVMHGYDLKHVARLILNSDVYQRQAQRVGSGESASEVRLFAGPAKRRMAAEQVVDSLFVVCEKPLATEALTLDPDGRRPVSSFLNLGVPRRAWQFTSLSNERDRPALALPQAQSVVDVLLAFGWRDSRPNPITRREEIPTVQQPLTLANGIMAGRVVRLSDDNRLTELCLQTQTLDKLIDELFLRTLSRLPVEEEREPIRGLLEAGFTERVLQVSDADLTRAPRRRHAVSWSNHLSAEATRIKQELERAARAGDPPTQRLDGDWRKRFEDVVWALVNSPEFIFIP